MWDDDDRMESLRAVNEPRTLRDLVLDARQARATSNRQLALAAQRAGFKIVDTTLNGIANGTYKARPTSETIRAIAWLADVDEEVAFAAAGVPVPGPPFAEELPPGVDHLSKRSRRAAIEVLRALVEAERGQAGTEAGGAGRDDGAEAEPAPPARLAAARELGEPSAGERLRDEQDRDAEVGEDPGRR